MAGTSWEDLAAGWERWRDHLDRAYAPVRAWALDALDVAPEHTILELAAGTGSAGIDAVVAAGRRPRLLATDLAPAMVAAARRRAHATGLTRMSVAVVDATMVGAATGSVDRVLCESGFMLVPDPSAALAEAHRVLRPAGRLVFSVWGSPADNPWDVVAEELLVELGHGRPAVGSPMADAGHVRALVGAAGFVDVRVDAVPVSFTWSDLDEWRRWSLATNTTAGVIGALRTDELAAFLDRLAVAFAPYRDDAGYTLPGMALCVSARR